jgi:hypothetical protein
MVFDFLNLLRGQVREFGWISHRVKDFKVILEFSVKTGILDVKSILVNCKCRNFKKTNLYFIKEFF